MPDAYPVQLVSPEHVLFDGEAEMVVCRPVEGAIAFLNGHVPYLGALADDEVRMILPGDGEAVAAVHGGFVQMTGDHLVVLSDLAELKADIDVTRGGERPTARRGSPGPRSGERRGRGRAGAGPDPHQGGDVLIRAARGRRR